MNSTSIFDDDDASTSNDDDDEYDDDAVNVMEMMIGRALYSISLIVIAFFSLRETVKRRNDDIDSRILIFLLIEMTVRLCSLVVLKDKDLFCCCCTYQCYKILPPILLRRRVSHTESLSIKSVCQRKNATASKKLATGIQISIGSIFKKVTQ